MCNDKHVTIVGKVRAEAAQKAEAFKLIVDDCCKQDSYGLKKLLDNEIKSLTPDEQDAFKSYFGWNGTSKLIYRRISREIECCRAIRKLKIKLKDIIFNQTNIEVF